jgi:hypothetical protein
MSSVHFDTTATDTETEFLSLVIGLGITWIDAANGKIRVALGLETGGYLGEGQAYDLSIKTSDYSCVSAERDSLNIQ